MYSIFLVINNYLPLYTFPYPASKVMWGIIALHHDLVFFLIIILILVFWLLLFILIKYNISFFKNESPFFIKNYFFDKNLIKEILTLEELESKEKKNQQLEWIWTVVPTIIIIWLVIPSFILLYSSEEDFDENNCNIILKIYGRQWYWAYELNFNNLIPNQHPFLSSGYFYNDLLFLIHYYIFDFINYLWNFEEILQNSVLFPGDSKFKLISFLNFEFFNNFNKTSHFSNLDSIYFYLSQLHQKELNIFFASFFNKINTIKPIFFESFIKTADNNLDTTLNYRLLEVDNPVILPTRTPIKLIITSLDVIHSWAIPSLGVKLDAIPGVLNEVIINIHYQGFYFGQCSEFCGINHGYMPIAIYATTFEQFIFKYNLF